MKYREYWLLMRSTLHNAPRMDKMDSSPLRMAATFRRAGLTTICNVCMYVWMYIVYAYVLIYVYMYVCMYVYQHVCM